MGINSVIHLLQYSVKNGNFACGQRLYGQNNMNELSNRI